MSFGQYRTLALTIPTLAAFAVISIIWFRHHQKKRRPRVDTVKSNVNSSSPIFEDELDYPCESAVEETCMSVETACCSTSANTVVNLAEADNSGEGEKQYGLPKEPSLEDIKQYIIHSVNHLNRERKDISVVDKSAEEALVETRSIAREEISKSNSKDLPLDQQSCDKVITAEQPNQEEFQTLSGESKTLAMQEEAKPTCEISKPLIIPIDKENNISVVESDNLSDLEEGEIRSSNTSFSDKNISEGLCFKQDSEDRDSVFDSEESDKKEIVNISEELESDIEEGEIRSLDGRTEDIMKKGKDELAEKLASLKLDQLKKVTDPKELTSLELDQMKMDDVKSGSERDSANHSPSEVMLASPSISNFSDAHSEGSSDSGKGQSDGATSPSRTPAGGSSLAGDHAPSVYEFVLPQIIVGRLIGRHGAYLHEIKTQTHTNIFIKRHPDSNKLKICAIEGTQQDIDKALAKIRQKFPLRRFPQLTLEKVSFIHLNSLPPLKPEDFHLQLVDGVNNDVVLSSLISAAHFFLQQPCHPSYGSLAALNTIMAQLYSSGEAPVLETPVNYAVCAAPAMGGWYRAQIVHVEEDHVCTVRYLDYGGYSRIPSSSLRQIRGDLLALPFQAVECYLANVAPPPGEDDWSEEARLFVQALTCGQVLQAQIYDYAEDGSPLVYLYSKLGNEVVLINEELVLRGFAVIAECGDGSCGTASEDGRTDDEGTRLDDARVRTSKRNKITA